MRIWNAIRRFSGIGKRIRADHAVHRASKRQTPTLRSLINRGLRMEQFEERMLLSITPSNLSELWEVNADLARSIENATNLDSYTDAELATATQWVVGLSSSDDSSSFHAQAANADYLTETPYLPNAAIWEFDSTLDWSTVADTLGCDGSIDYYYPLVYKSYDTMSVPNDVLFDDQWHLLNTGQNGGTAGEDANVVPAWDSVLGTGVVIGIVDSSYQYTHPDISTNYRADLSWDFGQNDADPYPEPGDEPHGTSVAGVAGGTGDNGIGISGSAPDADLVGMRLDFNSGWTDYNESLVFSHENQEIDIYNNSWGPTWFIDGPGPLSQAAIEDGAIDGRDGLGNIYVFSAGNSRTGYANTSYNGYTSSRYTIAVAAIDHNGEYSYYSTPGASVMISGYSNSVYSGITTTDELGEDGYNSTGTADNDPLEDIDYTSTFGGTSSAAPLVSGVIALVLEANPNLSYRDVQHILAETAVMNDADNPSWDINGAGYHVSNDYGFGAVDANAAVNLAYSWENVSEEKSTASGLVYVDQTIPDASATGLTQTVTMDDTIDSIEWVELVFDADHTSPGDLEISIISPNGTTSQLTSANTAYNYAGEFDNWSMTSCHHWGESSEGEWTIVVKDRLGMDVGTWNHFELKIYGTQEGDAPVEPVIPESVGLELLDVVPNTGGSVITEGSVQNVSPRELTFVFNEGQQIDPATLSSISMKRAGGDETFLNLNDESVEFGYIGIGDQPNEIVIRFAETLPDDLYQLTILGTGDSPLATLNGSIFHEGEDFTINFNLDLGAQVTAVVPQPTERLADGTIDQQRDTIEVYFNNDDLDPTDAQNTDFYSLIVTNETADTDGDLVFHPDTVTYDSIADKAVLTFEKDLSEYGTGAFRLRIGNEYYGEDTNGDGIDDTFIESTAYETELVADIFDNAHPITGLIGVTDPKSVTVSSIIEPQPYDITFGGGTDEQGHRNLPAASEFEGHYLGGADSEYGTSTIYYNFNQDLGNGYYNQITEVQKQRAREIFELYSTYLGVDFVEDTSTNAQGLTIGTGDLRAIDPQLFYTGPEEYVGLADYSTGLAVMDMAETWNNEYNGSWFNTAMHQVGHLLGIGSTYDLPDYSLTGNVGPTGGEYYAAEAESMYPGLADAIHGQYLHRTDSIDVDVYSFTLDTDGTISAEIIAERLADSSLLDSVVTIYDADHNMIARNDDYYSEDSYLELTLTAGTYYVAVSSTGNTEFDPEVPCSGEGGTSQGEYDLRLTFTPKQLPGEVNPSAPEHMVDTTGTMFDGDADGIQGGVYNFWFDVQTEENTIFVDKAASDYTGIGDLGSKTNPYTEIDAALANAEAGQIVRIVGNRSQDFDIQKTIDTLDTPEDAAVGDFNNDGIPDLVTIAQDNNDDFYAQIFYGIDGESYWSPISYEVGLNPGDLKVADLDNDGAEDIVVANSGESTVSLLINNGDGTFAPQTTRFTGANPVAIELGDLNGDGRVDLVIANEADDTVGILLSNDVSFFADQIIYSVRNDGTTDEVHPVDITLGDINNDDLIDIVSINQDGSITILVNQGKDYVTGQTSFAREEDNLLIGGTLSDGILADFDNDGDNDIALVDSDNSQVYVRLQNNSTGEFDAPVVLNVGTNPSEIGVGDSDGDGYLDIFVLNQGSNSVSVFFGLGDGTFGYTDDYTVGNNPTGMTIADTDRNGRPDIVVSNKDDNTISVLTATRDRAYEIGYDIDGNALQDGRRMEIPQDVTVMVDAGTMFKLRAANIDVGSSSQGIDRSEGSLQILGTPQTSVYFTSYHDKTMGVDTTTSNDEATPGDWGGLVFRSDIDYDNGNTVLESEGVFLNYVNNAEFYYGGGQVTVNSVRSVYAPIHMVESRPTIAFNEIYFSADAAMSADANSFADTKFQGEGYTNDYDRVGPDIYGNLVTENTLNGLYVRINTAAGSVLENLEIAARFDDTDIVHILGENLIIGSTPGGPTLAEDGTYEARTDGRLAIDPGIIIKLDQARIETEIGAQFIAEGTSELPIIFSSYLDTRYGAGGTFDTTSTHGNYAPEAGDWSGLYFGPTSTASLDNTVIAYGGGTSRVPGGFAEFNVVESHQAILRLTNSELEFNNGVTTDSNRVGHENTEAAVIYVKGSQPVLVNNVIMNNDAAAININANSLIADNVVDWGRSTGRLESFEEYDDNNGPLVRDNRLYNNDINGMVVRGEVLSTASIWDDTDIAHVLTSEIVTTNYHTEGGLRLESAADESLVVKLYGDDAGFTALGTPSEIDDRIGGTLQIIGMPGFPVILTSLRDDTVGAGVDPWGNFVFDTDNEDLDASPGDWRSVKLEEYVNDRNVAVVNEVEAAYGLGINALATKLTTMSASELKQLLNQIENLSAGFIDNMIESVIDEAALENVEIPQLGNAADYLRGKSTSEKIDILVYGRVTEGVVTTDLSAYGFDGLVDASATDIKAILKGLDSGFCALLTDAVKIGTNDTATEAQYIGLLAPDQKSGDDNLRLGYDIQGFIRTDDTTDADVYAFTGTAGTEVWFDVDSTSLGLNAVVELIDADGNVLAKSVNSAQEDLGVLERDDLTDGENLARTMDRDIWNINDQYTTNLNDPGMRVILPGSEGESLTYYVRVTSFNEDGDVLNTGDSRGAYQLQIRLQEAQEIAGSTVQKASIRYASTGIELLGLPSNSPLTVDAAETETFNNTFETAQDLGNLLVSDMGQLEVAGNIESIYDIDWYSFNIELDGIEDIEGVPVQEIQWPTIFDIDYADGMSRPDLVLYVFDSSGTLVYYGDDSNVTDDQPDPETAPSMDDLLRGSFGTADPFIGPVNLLEGVGNQYYVAVANRAMVPEVLDNAETRVEPINSITRVSEDQIGGTGESNIAGSPFSSILGDDTGVTADDIELNLHVNDYTLNDVVLYVTSGSEVYTVNPYTGQVQTDLTGSLQDSFTLTGSNYGDLVMRDDGQLYSLTLGDSNPGTIGTYTRFSTEDGTALSTQDDGITIFWDDDGSATEIEDSGIRFQAMAYLPDAVSEGLGLGTGGFIAVGNGGSGTFTENLLYFFNSSGQAVNPTGMEDPGDILPSNVIPWNQLNADQVVSTTDVTRTNDPDTVDGDTVPLDCEELDRIVTFEYDLGLVATVDSVPEDQDTFSVTTGAGPRTFEFDMEAYLQLDGDLTAIQDDSTFTLYGSDGSTNVTFLLNTTGSATGANIINLAGVTDHSMALNIIAGKINNQSSLGIIASPDQSSDTVTLSGCTGYLRGNTFSGNGLDFAGGGGVTTGNISVLINQSMSVQEVALAISNAANDAGIDSNAADTRVAFEDATSGDFTDAPLTQEGTSGAGITTGDYAVEIKLSDSAAQVATKLEAAVDATKDTTGLDASANANIVTVKGGTNGGTITGLTFVGGELYASDSEGTIFNIENYTSTGFTVPADDAVPEGKAKELLPKANNPLNMKAIENFGIDFTGLDQGPVNAEGSIYSTILFATGTDQGTGETVLFAVDVEGNEAPVFANGQSSIAISIGNTAGLAFSTLDYNLWHTTTERGKGDTGHGTTVAVDETRLPSPNSPRYPKTGDDEPYNTSFWFGYEDDTFPNADDYDDSVIGTYNLPGGAHGTLTTDTFSLAGYSADDLPILTFNYFLETDGGVTSDAATDTARVFISEDGVNWLLLASNTTNTSADEDLPSMEADYDVVQMVDGSGIWQQCEIDLSDQLINIGDLSNLRLKFEFATAGNTGSGNQDGDNLDIPENTYLQVADGEQIVDGDSFTLMNGMTEEVVEFTYSVGYSLVVANSAGQAIQDSDTLVIDGHTFEFDKDGNNSDDGTDTYHVISITDDDATFPLAEKLEAAFKVAFDNDDIAYTVNDRIYLPYAATIDVTSSAFDLQGEPGTGVSPVQGDNVAMVAHELAGMSASELKTLLHDIEDANPGFINAMTEAVIEEGDMENEPIPSLAQPFVGGATNVAQYLRSLSVNEKIDIFVDGKVTLGSWPLTYTVDLKDYGFPGLSRASEAEIKDILEGLDDASYTLIETAVFPGGVPGSGTTPTPTVDPTTIAVLPWWTADQIAAETAKVVNAYFMDVNSVTYPTSGVVDYSEFLTTLKVDGDLITFAQYAVLDAGPHSALSGSQPGDSRFEAGNDIVTRGTHYYSNLRGQDNEYEGFYIDDVVIGFAERGMMVTDAEEGNTAFRQVPTSEWASPTEYNPTPIVTGEYQLIIRSGSEYTTGTPFRSLDTNDRNTQAITLLAPAAGEIANYDSFVINDGVDTQTFQFVDYSLGLNTDEILDGAILIPYTQGQSAQEVAYYISEAINNAGTTEVTAKVIVGDNEWVSGSNRIDLFNVASVEGIDYLLFGDTSDNISQVTEEATNVVFDDLNNDGANDIVAINAEEQTAKIFLGDPDAFGNYIHHETIMVGANASDIAVADISGDGLLDLIVSNYGDDTVTIAINSGAGSFNQPITLATGNAPTSVEAADVNDDGLLDLIVSCGNDNTIEIYLGEGNLADGTPGFGTKSTIDVGVTPKEFVVADLDEDGDLDIATVNMGDNSVSILINDGAGNLSLSSTASVGRMPVAIAVGDLNGDDHLDIATADRGDNTITVLLNDDANLGNFAAAAVSTYATGSDPVDIQILDITGDGVNDIGTVNYGDSTLTNLMGLGADATTNGPLFDPEGDWWNIGTFATNGGPTSFVYGSVSGLLDPDMPQEMLITDTTGQVLSMLTPYGVFRASTLYDSYEQESVNLNQLTGDTNHEREQGYVIIAANEVLYAETYGIMSDAGTVDDATHPGAVAPLREENTEQLVPGISIKNNLVVGAGNAGIFFSGSPDATENGNDTAIPFGRILNNTIYDCRTGIMITENASPTLLNNIVSNNRTGISIDDTCQSTVVGGMVYHENNNNTAGMTYGDLGDFAIVLGADDPLFVDAENNNFYLAENSEAIDSAIDSLEERDTLADVTDPLGIAPSPILAPEYDLYGQQRSDDPNMDTPPGMGMSLFKDRGAIDRIDFTAPTSSLIDPMDNDDAGIDRNPDENDAFIAYERVSVFGIQLTDPVGAGIDDNTVVSDAVKIYKNGSSQPLIAGQDYFFRYDSGTNVVRLYPASGLWDTGSTYKIVLDNSDDTGIADIAGNPVRANRYDGTTVFNVSIANFDYGDAPEDANNDKLNYPTLLNNTTDTTEGGARHLQIGDYYLGNRVTGEDDANLIYDEDTGELITGAKGDAGDDGVLFDDSVIIVDSNIDTYAYVTVTASRNGGYLNAWIDYNADGDWDDPGEKIITGEELVKGENRIKFTVPANTDPSATYARFRYSSVEELGVGGEAPDGEVEDYQIHLVSELLDFGDAPDSYGTTLESDGARHEMTTTLFLGSSVDSELNAVAHPNALGDDQIGVYDPNENKVINDEDGIEFTDYLQPGEVATIQVTASAAGWLKAWIDFNGDGTWDAGEDITGGGLEITTAMDLDANTSEITFNYEFMVPEDAQAGTTFARFRLYQDGVNVASTGAATDANNNTVTPLGEVEDYAIVITEQPRDFGDAPRSYQTQQTSEPATALIELPGNNNDIFLTAVIPGTDYNSIKISIVNEITYGDNARVTFNAVTNSYLIDVDPEATTAQSVIDAINKEGTFVAVRDVTNDVNNDGTGLVDVDPGLIAITDGGHDGFGEEAAMHDLGSKLALGELVDAEINGQPSDDAMGDDQHDSDDEDGFDFSQTTFIAGGQTTFEFSANMGDFDTAYLTGWIDLNQDGVFSSDEQVIYDLEVTETSDKTVTITLPIATLEGETYARFRISSQAGLDWHGVAPDGEVEDYKIEIRKGDATISGYAFQDLNYNEAWDANEKGHVGVVIYIDLNENGWLDYTDANGNGEFDLNIDTPTEPYTISMDDDPSTPEENETGYYEFSGLLGRVTPYTIRQITPDGFLQSYPNELVTLPDGSHGNKDGSYSILLEDSELISNANFGNFQKSHVTIDDVVVTEGDDGYTDIDVTVTLSQSFGADLTFTYDTADGTAIANYDYVPKSGTFTFDAQSTPVAAWTTSVLTTTETNDYDYSADGQFVIWEGFDGHDWEIYLFAGEYDIEDKPVIHQLTDNTTDDRDAVIYASQNINKTLDVMVAWTGKTEGGSDTEIFVYKSNFDKDGTLNSEAWSGALTNNAFNDQAPQLSDTYLTWWGDDGRSNEIFYRELADISYDPNTPNPAPKNLTENDYLDQAPIVQGSNIVWVGDMGRGNELFLFTGEYDVYNNPVVTQITNNYTDDNAPQIDGNNIVWEGEQGSAYQIFVYQIDTGTVSQVTSTPKDNRFPQISGNDVVWQSRQGSDWEIFHYNIEAGTDPVNISNDYYQSDEHPEILNEMIVWRSFNGHNYETYYHKLRTDGSISSISNPENSVWYPHITEDFAVWRSFNGTSYDIVIAEQEQPQTTQTIKLRVIGDLNIEDDETFFLNIQAVENDWVEFEDAQAMITILNDDGEIDFGDAPESYSTFLVDNGARHLASDTFTATLGETIDREEDARPSEICDGDDTYKSQDEDGVIIETIGQDTVATLTVYVNNPDGNVCYLDAWVDFKQEGNWDGLNDRILDGVQVYDGENTITFTVPNDAVAGLTNARFRLSGTGGLDYTGQIKGGEVEDYQIEITAKPILVDGIVTINGTNDDDEFIFVADDTLTVTLNNSTYTFDADDVDQILFDGGEGNDTVIFYASDEEETVNMWTDRAQFIGANDSYTVDTNHVEAMYAFAGNDADVVTMTGSVGDDTFLSDPTSRTATLTGDSFALEATNFCIVNAFGAGGNDMAGLNGSVLDDTYTVSPETAQMVSAGVTTTANDFRYTFAYAVEGGVDKAILNDSDSTDMFNFTANPEDLTETENLTGIPITLNSLATLGNEAFELTACNFAYVTANSSGGKDEAYLTGSPGQDNFDGRPLGFNPDTGVNKIGSYAKLYSTDLVDYNCIADGFRYVTAVAVAGSNPHEDFAVLEDSQGADTLVATSNYAKMSGTGYYYRADFFPVVETSSTHGGEDIAILYDSAEDDYFDTYAGDGQIEYGGRGSGHYVSASQFKHLTAIGGSGGDDIAALYGSSANDIYMATDDYAKMNREGNDSYYRAISFQTIIAYGGGGDDVAYLYDSVYEDLLTANGSIAEGNAYASMEYEEYDFLREIYDFNEVHSKSSNTGDQKDIEDSVDFLFTEGLWTDKLDD